MYLIKSSECLIYETVIGVLTGLTNCSMPDFLMLLDLLLQQVNAKAVDTDTHEKDILEQVKTILNKTVDVYHSLCTIGKWHVSSKSTGHFNFVCWNYEKEGCSVNQCPQQAQKKIATEKKKFSEQKRNGGSASGKNKPLSKDSSTQNQNKWGTPKSGNGFKCFGQKFMYCGKKGCDQNTTYTRSFHNDYEQNPTTFCLPYTHPYMKSLHKLDETPPDMAPASITSGFFLTKSIITSTIMNTSANNDVLHIKCLIAFTGLNKLKTQFTNLEIAQIANIFCTMFN